MTTNNKQDNKKKINETSETKQNEAQSKLSQAEPSRVCGATATSASTAALVRSVHVSESRWLLPYCICISWLVSAHAHAQAWQYMYGN